MAIARPGGTRCGHGRGVESRAVGAAAILSRRAAEMSCGRLRRATMVALATSLALGGCASIASRPPAERIALWCNPVGHVVDLAIVGVALGAAAYGLGGLALGSASNAQSSSQDGRGIPGTLCYRAIADQVDAKEGEGRR